MEYWSVLLFEVITLNYSVLFIVKNHALYYDVIRFQEIAGALDSELVSASLVPVQDSQSSKYRDLTLKQSVALLNCLRTCWREDVLVLSCADKFLRLSLQLLSRLVRLRYLDA